MFLGDLIKEYRSINKLSLRDFAKQCGLSHTYISALEKNIDPRTGKPIAPTLDTVKYVSRGMNKSIEEILKVLDEQQEFIVNEDISKDKLDQLGNPVVEVPLLGVVKAGYDYLAQENWIGTVDVDKKLAESGKMFALKIKGDSMSPVLIEDDIVIIKKQEDFESGDIVVAIINGDEATIKKGKKSDNSILLQPLNTNYEPLIFTYDEMKTIPVAIVRYSKTIKKGILKILTIKL